MIHDAKDLPDHLLYGGGPAGVYLLAVALVSVHPWLARRRECLINKIKTNVAYLLHRINVSQTNHEITNHIHHPLHDAEDLPDHLLHGSGPARVPLLAVAHPVHTGHPGPADGAD